ncbi:MAG: malate dehydrogenase [Acidimicrobiia bacterium]
MNVIGERDVRTLAARSDVIVVGSNDLLTPNARDLVAQLGLRIVSEPIETAPPNAPDHGTAVRRVLLRRSPKWVAPEPTTAAKAKPFARVAMVGCGAVGAAAAHMVAATEAATDLTIVDLVPGLAASTALDIEHASGITGSPTRCAGGETMDLVAGADVVVVTAGSPRSPGMSRADLRDINAKVIKGVAAAVEEFAPNAVLIVVTNPLDEMTYEAYRSTDLPRERVLGMAGTLDSSRFRWALATAAEVHPRDVSAFTLGSHGDEMVPILSLATIRGRPVEEVLDPDAIERCVQETVGGGGRIVALRRTGSASIAPAHSIVEILDAMRGAIQGPIPVSVVLEGEYGISDVVVGVPVQLGRGGLEKVVELPLTPSELAMLQGAASVVKERLVQ